MGDGTQQQIEKPLNVGDAVDSMRLMGIEDHQLVTEIGNVNGLQIVGRETVSVAANCALIWGEVSRKMWRDDAATSSWIKFLHDNNPFIFDHIGDVYEAGMITLGTRAFIELVDRLHNKSDESRQSPRVKMWLSVLVGVAVPFVIEGLGLGIGGNSVGSDWADAFVGPLVSGAVVGGSWEFINFLTAEETILRAELLSEHFKNGVNKSADGLLHYLDDLTHGNNNAANRIGKALDLMCQNSVDWMDSNTKKLEKINFEDTSDPSIYVDRVLNAITRIVRK